MVGVEFYKYFSKLFLVHYWPQTHSCWNYFLNSFRGLEAIDMGTDVLTSIFIYNFVKNVLFLRQWDLKMHIFTENSKLVLILF